VRSLLRLSTLGDCTDARPPVRRTPPAALAFKHTRAPPHHRHHHQSYGMGSWGTLASLCFLFSALFEDLLLIRFCLMMAYATLVINIALGIPDILNWGLAPTPVLLVGSLALNSVVLALHVSFCVCARACARACTLVCGAVAHA
jgi:heme/copper-type cytochrome/quinol oxidase subunit 3